MPSSRFVDEFPDFETLDVDGVATDVVPGGMGEAIAGKLLQASEEHGNLKAIVNQLRAAVYLKPTTNRGDWLVDDLNEAISKLSSGPFPKFMDAIASLSKYFEFSSDRTALGVQLNDVFEHFSFGYRIKSAGVPYTWGHSPTVAKVVAKAGAESGPRSAPVTAPRGAPRPPIAGPGPLSAGAAPVAGSTSSSVTSGAASAPKEAPVILSGKTLIIHGHDDNARLQLKDLLMNELGLPEPVVMGDGMVPGASLPEKFEKLAGQVEFAVALMTPDDLGRAKDSASDEQRVRQNVLVEIGWFWGRLGRERLLLLVRDSVNIPSDLQGVEFHTFHKNVSEAALKIQKFYKVHGVKLK